MKARQSGFVLIAMSISMLLMVAVVGLGFDLGRIYIARNEAQVFTDAAALTAASRLDGTAAGVERARQAVSVLPIRWDLGTKAFTGVVVEFSPDGQRWYGQTEDSSDAGFARVTAPANEVEITLPRAVGGPESFTVPAHSVAATAPVRLVE